MPDDEEVQPSNLTNIVLSFASQLQHLGVIPEATSENLGRIEQALQATVHHLGQELLDHAYEMPDGTLRRVKYDPGFYGFEGATEIVIPYKRLEFIVSDGPARPARP